ncbi:Rne/Rng family ribonuclease [Chrysiogenes arsenatis]|uniref:Rne/Rng family ribonuclease n=1 Tax=Chrysiogenes arsenatis TaxID=309797 RepID=UPI000418F998|nr:Rne/Rng family ribonuclease [Chrysiogenes arsenatis]
MSRKIIINRKEYETRVAYLENDELVELFIERKQESSLVGNIYKGVVTKVLPGMQAAFVDIGLEKAAFLYVADIEGANDDFSHLIDGVNRDPEHSSTVELPCIDELVKVGDQLLVQISKEPISTKGARITTYVTLPGRHLVLMPTINHVGISRRIEREHERERLRTILEAMRPAGVGMIARTVAENKNADDLRADLDFLSGLWKTITQKNGGSVKAPALLYQDLDLTFKTMRDLFTREVDSLIVDDEGEYNRAREFAARLLPHLHDRIEHYRGKEPIFDAFNIEVEVAKIYSRKVWLKSGGYIVIDQGEALTAVDVNTGRYVGKKNLEDTLLQTNLEAAKEIAYQLRLRNIGGIIIIDFIDMEDEENRQRVVQALEHSLKIDRAKTNVLPFSELGLVEMTRKRVRDSLGRILCEPCHYCEGKGFIKSPHTVCYEIFREIRRISGVYRGKKLYVEAYSDIADILFSEAADYVETLENDCDVKLVIKSNNHFHQEHYEIVPL